MADAQAPRDVFPGPRPFQPGESHLFFGRQREAQDLYDLALSYRVLLLYSRSGAGKTSLVNATLVHRLEEAGYRTLRGRVAGTVPSPSKLTETPGFNIHVFNALTTLLGSGIPVERAAAGTLTEHFGAGARGTATYLILDQFEELFTLHPDRWTERDGFFLQLSDALRDNPDLHVLISIREDFVANLDPYGDHVPGGLRFRYRLERLRASAALEAILHPLEQGGIRVESRELAEGLVRDLSVERVWLNGARRDIVGEFVEPLHLQVVCRRLVAALGAETVITAKHVATYAKVNQALGDYYNAALARAVAVYRRGVGWMGRTGAAIGGRGGFEARLRRWINRHLVTGSGTRAFAFAGDAHAAGIPPLALQSLAAERIVHVEHRAGADWIELSHDRFVDPIKAANAAWIAPRRAMTIAAAVTIPLLAIAILVGFAWRARRAQEIAAAIAQQQEQLRQANAQLATARVEANRDAATARGFETVLTTRLDSWGAAPTQAALTPQELDVRLDAASRLERMQVREQCGGTTVVFYVRSAPHPQTRARLTSIWREYRFTVTEDDARGIPQQMNAVWYGRDVKPMCWRAIACTLIRAGVPVRQIGQPGNDPEGKRLTIEVGYSGPARERPPLTVAELWSIR